MRSLWIAASLIIPAAAAPRPEPKITSVFPMGGQPAAEFELTVRGANLVGARAVVFAPGAGSGRVLEATDGQVRIAVRAANVGLHQFRIVAESGVTNEGAIRIDAAPLMREGETPGGVPFVIDGRLEQRGEVDSYWIEAKAGETVALEARSGFPGFDPALSIWAPGRSWFNAERLARIAFNDEPLHFPGLDHDARLVHRFEVAGKYCIRVGAFSGQGGADYVYRLRAAKDEGPAPKLHPIQQPEWTERQFTRTMTPDWSERIAKRGIAKPPGPVETYRAVPEGSTEIPTMGASGMIEGRLGRGGEAHVIRMKLDEPRDLVIEIETPEATMPRFNPVVRVMQSDGHEVATSVYTKRNNNGLYMMKMIQAKTVVTLRSVGEYTIQIRDITNDCWSPDFAYRVLVRARIAHIGTVGLVEDHVNLEPGQSKPLTVTVDREEGFKGFAAIGVEGLPPGVTAVAGLENPVERPPLPNAGRRERYYPIPQTATVMLLADPGAAPLDGPVFARVVVRPVVDGVVGEPVLVKQVPVMVVARKAS